MRLCRRLAFAAAVCISGLVVPPAGRRSADQDRRAEEAERIPIWSWPTTSLPTRASSTVRAMSACGRPEPRALLHRVAAPALVTADDIMEFDLDDQPIDARAARLSGALHHSEIYKARPTCSRDPPFPGCHTVRRQRRAAAACFAHGRLPAHASPCIRDRSVGGTETDMLIRNKALGGGACTHAWQRRRVLMRGHGDVVVGQSIRTAVAHAIYTELNAAPGGRRAADGGKDHLLNEAEAAKTGQQLDQLVDRPWENLKIQALSHTQKN